MVSGIQGSERLYLKANFEKTIGGNHSKEKKKEINLNSHLKIYGNNEWINNLLNNL